jgi:molecular chaperone Hsp33
MMQPSDFHRAFIFEHLDIRGAIVRLGPAWRAMRTGRDYPAPVQRLLGETAAVSVLIGANLKQPGRLTFQLKGEGPVNMLVVDCDDQLRVRGMARHDGDVPDAPAPELLGDGQLLLTLDANAMTTPYQSLVPLAGDSIGAIFEHYLERSEQQATRLILAADDNTAAGLFLQKMPGADQRDMDGWNRVQILAETLRAAELLALPVAELLTSLFPEEEIRLYDPRPVSYHCPRDLEKVRGMLQTLGQAECRAMLDEQGHVTVHDDICNHTYRFEAADVEALFAARTLH